MRLPTGRRDHGGLRQAQVAAGGCPRLLAIVASTLPSRTMTRWAAVQPRSRGAERAPQSSTHETRKDVAGQSRKRK